MLHLAPAMFVLTVGFGLGVIALTQAAVYRVDANMRMPSSLSDLKPADGVPAGGFS